MPTYEYLCEKCRKPLDVVQSMKDEPLTICPKELCQMKSKWGKGRVKRQLGTGAGLIFKGSGFYITDYRSENYKTSAKNESASAAPATPAKTPEAAPGAKPAEKTPKTPAATPAKPTKSDS